MKNPFFILLSEIVFCLFLGCVIFTITYPGNLEYDFNHTWITVRGGSPSNWHGILMPVTVKWFITLFGDKPSLFIFLQINLYFLSAFYLFKKYFSFLGYKKNWIFVIAAPSVFVFLPVSNYAATSVKDVIAAIFLNLICIFLLKKQNIKNPSFVFLAGFFAALFFIRVSSIVFLIIFVSFLLLRFSKKWKSTFFFIGCFFVVVSIGFLFSKNYFKLQEADLDKAHKTMLLVGYFNELTNEEKKRNAPIIEKLIGIDGLEFINKKNYACGDAWRLLMDRSESNSQSFIDKATLYQNMYPSYLNEQLVKFLFKNPGAVIEYHGCVISKLLRINDSTNFYWQFYQPDSIWNIKTERPLSKLHESYVSYIEGFKRVGLHKLWIIVLISSLLFSVLTVFKIKNNSLPVFLCAFGYLLQFFIFPTAYEWRYIFPTYQLLIMYSIISIIQLSVWRRERDLNS